MFGNSQANAIGHTPRTEWGERWQEERKETNTWDCQRSRSPELEGLEEQSRWGEPGGLRLRPPDHRAINHIRMKERGGALGEGITFG